MVKYFDGEFDMTNVTTATDVSTNVCVCMCLSMCGPFTNDIYDNTKVFFVDRHQNYDSHIAINNKQQNSIEYRFDLYRQNKNNRCTHARVSNTRVNVSRTQNNSCETSERVAR